MKLKEVFEKSLQFFKEKKIENPRRDVEILISRALKLERVQLYLKYDQPLSESEIQNCRDVIRRRALGEPVAYIVEEKGFYGETYKVGAGVLIPRPETEIIVEEALKFIKLKEVKSPRVLDLGAGTGCIGFSILKNCEAASLVSVEKSEAAFNYLKANQNLLGLEERSQLILADVLEFGLEGQKFDVIVANPPYISEQDTQTELNVKKFEPHSALFSGADGFQALYSWTQVAKDFLSTPGVMLFEIGYQQGPKLKQHVAGFNQFQRIEILKDLSGLDRILICT